MMRVDDLERQVPDQTSALMDAIESGIVKLPRVPISDNVPGHEMPIMRELWPHIRTKIPKRKRGETEADPAKLNASFWAEDPAKRLLPYRFAPQVELRDRTRRELVTLEPGGQALLLEPNVWAAQTYETPESVLLVLASAPYDPSDYFHDWLDA